jgi:hypothetical protein
MRSPWRRDHGSDQVPVEMRFIDMFMTALGSLVFLCLLLVFLLPKTTSSPPTEKMEEEIRRLKKSVEDQTAENQQLKQQLRQITPYLRRWFGVFLMTSGCKDNDPELYVRYEGKIFNFERQVDMPDAVPFDVTNLASKSMLLDHRYLDIGAGVEVPAGSFSTLRESPTAGLDLLSKNGLNAKLFFGTGWPSDNAYSVYVALRDPRTLGDAECKLHPFYLSPKGIIPAEPLSLTQQRPFAWLRRAKIDADGNTTLGTSPRADAQFKRDIAVFSDKQSKALCEQSNLCDTMDAHYALLLSLPTKPATLPPPQSLSPPASNPPTNPEVQQPPKPGLSWKPNQRLFGELLAPESKIPRDQCEAQCVDDNRCHAVEFVKDGEICRLFKSIEQSRSGSNEVAYKN